MVSTFLKGNQIKKEREGEGKRGGGGKVEDMVVVTETTHGLKSLKYLLFMPLQKKFLCSYRK